MECNICTNNNKDLIILSKCNHKLCIECLLKLKKSECPFCRYNFSEIIKNIKKNNKNNEINQFCQTINEGNDEHFYADSLNNLRFDYYY